MHNQNLFRNMPFIRLLIGSTASGFSTWGLVFLLGLLVASDELNATQLGFLLGIRTIGFLCGVLFGGIWADGLSRRIIILGSSLMSMLAILLIILGLASYSYVLYLGAVLAGLGQGGCRPAYQAMVVQVVELNHRQAANAWMGLSIRLVNLLGPTLTSAVVLVMGSTPAFLLLFIMWGLSAFLPPWIDETKQPIKASKASFSKTFGNTLADLADGLREAKRHPWFLWSLLALTLVIATGYSATNVILPLISETNGGLMLMTQCITAYTLGGAVGAIVMSRFHPKQVGWYALIGMASYGLAPLSLLFDESFIALLGYFIAGFGIEMFNVLWFAAIQREVPETHLARISALDFLCSYGLAPLGLAVIAPIANVFGHEQTLLLCGLICLIFPLLAMFSRSSKFYTNFKE